MCFLSYGTFNNASYQHHKQGSRCPDLPSKVSECSWKLSHSLLTNTDMWSQAAVAGLAAFLFRKSTTIPSISTYESQVVTI